MNSREQFIEFKKQIVEFTKIMEVIADTVDGLGYDHKVTVFREDTRKMREGMMLFQAGIDSMINKMEKFQEIEDLLSGKVGD